MIIFTLSPPISLNRKLTKTRRGHNIISSEYKEWQNDARMIMKIAARNQDWTMTDKIPLKIDIAIYGEKRRRDLDNYLKVLLDAGEGVLYKNDNMIDDIHEYRVDVDKKKESKIIVKLSKI